MSKKIKTYNLPVAGMTCASCVARVEKVLNKFDGLENVKVNYGTEKVSFDVVDSNVDIKAAASKLEQYGYKIKFDDNSRNNKADNVNTDAEYIQLKSDFKFALILTVPIFFISMFSSQIDLWPFSMETNNKILLILTTPLMFISGKRFFITFWKNLKNLSFEMNSLVAIGTVSAFGYSTIITLFPELSNSGFINHNHVYFETAAVIITLILMGKVLESKAKNKTNSAIQKLLELKPKTALLLENGIEKTLSVDELLIGHNVVIKPGDKIPADGIIISGFSTVDESMVTGESIPTEKNIGSNVIGGTINKNGSFIFEINAIGDNSVLGQIIKLVEEAQGSKAPIQKLADKVASIFVPTVIIFAIITFIGWIIFGTENIIAAAIINFVAVLIIACPCALGLATPTAIMVGTGLGAKKGILIKNGESLEIAHKVNTVVLDKTGTITEGKPEVTDLISFNHDKGELINFAGSLEKKSHHPLAEAVVQYSTENNTKFMDVESFVNHDGLGITGTINGVNIFAGNKRLMENHSINTSVAEEQIEKFTSEGKSIILVSINGVLSGVFAIQDPVKESSEEAIENFKEMGLDVIMLTGDNTKTAGFIAQKVGISKVFADVLPNQKAEKIDELKNDNKFIAMVGDGINDAPALVTADLGIAIGSGTDIAIESSDFTLVGGKLTDVVSAIKLSRRTIKTIKQNLFWAFIYNIVGIPLAAFGMLNPMIGALAMSLSSVSVLSNSLRLRNMKFD